MPPKTTGPNWTLFDVNWNLATLVLHFIRLTMPLKTKDYKRVHFTPDYSDFAKFNVSKVLIRLQCFF